jgi:hypothetical protein
MANLHNLRIWERDGGIEVSRGRRREERKRGRVRNKAGGEHGKRTRPSSVT